MLIAEDDHDYGVGPEDAQKFTITLADRLSINLSFLIPGYEDIRHHIGLEQQLPDNIDPLKYNLDDPEERRAREAFGTRVGENRWFRDPLRKDKSKGWTSGRWFFGANECTCSPAIRRWVIGYRSIRSRGKRLRPPDRHRTRSLHPARTVAGHNQSLSNPTGCERRLGPRFCRAFATTGRNQASSSGRTSDSHCAVR